MSEPIEPPEPPAPIMPDEAVTPGALLRSLLAATRPRLLQKAVARRLGVSPGTVSDWLRDRHQPRWDHLDQLERLLVDHGVALHAGLLSERFHVRRREEGPGAAAAAVYPLVPTPLTPLIGREQDVVQLLCLWEEHRLVSVTGPAGVGKTRLAAAVAERINDKSPGEVVWLRVGDVGDVDELYQLIALAVHARTVADSSLLGAIGRAMGGHPRTLVLDDLDRLDDGGLGAIVRLLERCAQLRVMVTARRGMHGTGVARFRVEPLACPCDAVDDDEAREYPAVRLFAALATQAGTRAAVERAPASHVREICRALGGLPFCLELAAAQLDTITMHELHLHLTTSEPTGGFRTAAVEGDAALAAALQVSWTTLSPIAQYSLACSSVFNGSFDADRASRVIALSPSAVTSALHELVRSSMVQVDHSELQSTYHLLGPLRRFAAQVLDELGDSEEVRGRQARHVAEILDAQFPLSHADAVERVGWSDLLAALRWAVASDRTLSLLIAGNLWPQWLRVGAFSTGRGWLATVLASCGDVPGMARAVVGAGVLAQREGDAERAASHLHRGLGLAIEEGDERARQVAVVNLGWLALVEGRGDEAAHRAEDLLAQLAGAAPGWGAAAAHSLRGTVRTLRDDAGAAADFDQSLTISTAIGDRPAAISARLQLGRLALRRGDARLARSCAAAGLAEAERIGDQSLTGAALVGVGAAARAEGRWDEATTLLEQAVQVMGGSEEPIARCRTLLELALARAHAGDADDTELAIADIVAATDIAVAGNVNVLLPLCFETMSEVVPDPTDSEWLRLAASVVRQRIELAHDATEPTADDGTLAYTPQRSELMPFVEILRRVEGGR